MNSQIRYIEMAITSTAGFAGRFANRNRGRLNACGQACTNDAYRPIRIKLVLENGISENSYVQGEMHYGQEMELNAALCGCR